MIKKTRRSEKRVRLTIMGLLLFFGASSDAYTSGENWEDYQKEYVKKVSGLAGKDIKKSFLGIKVIEVPELRIRDRCTSCHVAMDDLRMFGDEQPLKPHPSSYLQHHPPERFGCTICHGGQGESLGLKESHSGTHRKGDLAQVSCARCHREAALEGAPKLTRGKSLLKENQCTNCHYTQDLSEREDFRPAPLLRGIGSKVNEKWLWRWLKDPKRSLPNAIMPRYEIDEKYVDALVGYLMNSKDPRIEASFDYPEGDVDRGKGTLRLAFCITCHPFNGKGGNEAPDLGKIGNKVREKWLVQMLANPHVFQPKTPMPQYNLDPRQISDMAAYLLDEFADYDLLDQDEALKLPAYWANPKERSEIGRRVYKELRCANCHGLLEETGWWRKIGPEFTQMGDKRVIEMNFGNSKTPRTLPDYIFEKIRNPQAYATPDNFMKMPKYDLSNEEIRDIVLALLSFNANKVGVSDYRFPKVESKKYAQEGLAPLIFSSDRAVVETYHPTKDESKRYDPEGEFRRLVSKFRCFSCHSFNGRGHNISYDLSTEGSRVRRKWMYNYMKLPYTIRPILTLRMPIFNMTDEEAKIFTDTFMRKMVDPEIEKDLEAQLNAEMVDKGKTLFEAKGCFACHQVGKKGGYVGPSFTQGAFVGEKLRAGWVFKWLKDPQAIKPDVLEPNYGFSDEEALALTAYLMSIKKPGQLVSGNRKNE